MHVFLIGEAQKEFLTKRALRVGLKKEKNAKDNQHPFSTHYHHRVVVVIIII